MRGRLIQQLVCVLRRLDPVATAAVVGGGYDPEFDEPRPVPDGTQTGASSRREQAAMRIRCQVGRDSALTTGIARSLTPAGQQDTVVWTLLMHRTELEAKGLLVDGVPQIFPGDRVEALETVAGAVVHAFPVPPGLYVTGVDDAGFGLAAFGTPQINLCVLRCEPAPIGEGART